MCKCSLERRLKDVQVEEKGKKSQEEGELILPAWQEGGFACACAVERRKVLHVVRQEEGKQVGGRGRQEWETRLGASDGARRHLSRPARLVALPAHGRRRLSSATVFDAPAILQTRPVGVRGGRKARYIYSTQWGAAGHNGQLVTSAKFASSIRVKKIGVVGNMRAYSRHTTGVTSGASGAGRAPVAARSNGCLFFACNT